MSTPKQGLLDKLTAEEQELLRRDGINVQAKLEAYYQQWQLPVTASKLMNTCSHKIRHLGWHARLAFLTAHGYVKTFIPDGLNVTLIMPVHLTEHEALLAAHRYELKRLAGEPIPVTEVLKAKQRAAKAKRKPGRPHGSPDSKPRRRRWKVKPNPELLTTTPPEE